jgi:hypothetical protein
MHIIFSIIGVFQRVSKGARNQVNNIQQYLWKTYHIFNAIGKPILPNAKNFKMQFSQYGQYLRSYKKRVKT